MVDTLEQFAKMINNKKNMRFINNYIYKINSHHIDEQFCPHCGAIRKCELTDISSQNEYKYTMDEKAYCNNALPYVYETRCLQCEHKAVLVIYTVENETRLAVLHDTYSGCITPNTPSEAKYYIDQAFRARSMGAYSAAMAMYRSALEWILYDQGYNNGMLGKKIDELQKDITNGKAPKWAMEINVDFLMAIKEIGNGAIHTNNGDINKQKDIDNDLIEIVDVVFAELLDKIYEQPSRSTNNLNKLKQVVSNIKK